MSQLNSGSNFPNQSQAPISGGGYYISPNTSSLTSTNYNLITLHSNVKPTYSVLKLPIHKIPMRVFLCGRLVTVGVLGSNAECAFMGDHLVFEPGFIEIMVSVRKSMGSYTEKLTLSLEYKDKIYHYFLGEFYPEYKDDSKILDASLISVIETD